MAYLNVEQAAASIISEASENMDIYELMSCDFSSIEDDIWQRVHQDAENYCTYYHQCLDYISQLESEYSLDIEESEVTFQPYEWADAARHYAIQLVVQALSSQINTALDEFKERIQEFVDVVEGFQDRYDIEADQATLSNSCTYGWTPHNYETVDGVMVWSDEKVKGSYNPVLLENELIAISHEIAPNLHANLAFNPQTADWNAE